MKLHPREPIVTRAQLELDQWLIAWTQRHDLTLVEELGCIRRALDSPLHSMLQQERHPDDPTKPTRFE